MLFASIAALSLTITSCDKEKTPQTVAKGTVTGTVFDVLNAPISDVNVTVKGTKLSAVTAADGTYEIKDVPMQKQTILFEKENFAATSVNINEASFKDGVASEVNATMQVGICKITGRCVDGSGANAPLAGVVVKLNGSEQQTTGEDGVYSFENLTIDNYTLLFQKVGCVDVEKSVKAEMFTGASNYVVALEDVRMGAREVLPGATADDLKRVDVWHYNEYRGGKNGDDYPHFDWSSDYMGTFTSWYGWWEEQNEGTTLQIRNDPNEHQANPADLEHFDSYLAGRKLITEDNKILSIKVRTHGADEASPVYWGVMVVDLSTAEPEAVRIGEIRKYGSSNYSNPDESFDLSAYVGKEVVIAVGIYRAETGDYWKQLCLRRLAFTDRVLTTLDEWSYIPGDLVPGLNAGYKMTMQMVRSTMPVDEISEFIGISPVGRQDIDGPEMYRDAYKTWRNAGHFAAWWSCMPVKKDSEPFAGEGYVMKTNSGGTEVSLDDPQSYFYAKFAISEGHNMMELNCRNFSSENATFFKLTAITEDGAVEHILPAESSKANTLEVKDNGCVRFIHEDGNADNFDGYAHINYDLSKFNGKNVVLALAVFKGEDNGDENKLSIHSIRIK